MPTSEEIDSYMKENRIFYPPEEFKKRAHIKSMHEYDLMYQHSIEQPEEFWAGIASNLHWFAKWNRVFTYTEKPFVHWFEGAKTNVCYNCIDRHITTWRKNKAALIWENEDGSQSETYTYQELHREVCKFANVLKKKGLKKGDRVCLYMPMIPELAIAMLACARIGVIHSIVFGGFSSASLQKRIEDCEAKALITADGTHRKGKVYPLKANADEVLQSCPSIQHVIVAKRTGQEVPMQQGRDSYWTDEMTAQDIHGFCPAEEMDSEDSFFILYTSGTTGKPKGVLHTTGGYMVYAYATAKYIFDLKDEDTYWCTADIGWITGHSYIVYGPLLNGTTSIMFEGIPTYPKADRWWEIVEKYKVTIFYTAPTAIRSLARESQDWPNRHDLSSLRLLGSVGEPINPEAWMWYYRVIGKERCPIVDTWWQTETGGIMIAPLPGVTPLKPGSATKPFFGILPEVFKEDGTPAKANEGGNLVIKKPWPSMERTIWGDPERYKKTYFSKFPDVYFAGDSARKDSDGYFWIMGRLDDVIKVSGHRLGTAEVESAIVANDKVAEAAVVPIPHDLKGEAIYAYVTLKEGVAPSVQLEKEITETVAREMGPIAKPEKIQFADALPKTRSGKIMRRILKAIATGAEIGDTTTLSDPAVVEILQKGKN
ncbi:TPA: acetate--CoA ligase [Candidatus Woesearchaeota archaeon]|nr:acetate--CoA ligase [Candidatus Woesearchaeota archaeon]